MYAQNFVEFLDIAVQNNGLIQVPDYAYSLSQNGCNNLQTYTEKHNAVFHTLSDYETIFPIVDSSESNKTVRSVLSSCFVKKDGKFYIDLFEVLHFQNKDINELKSFYNYFKQLREALLKYSEQQIFFQFYKEKRPVRLDFDVISQNNSLTDDVKQSIMAIEIPDSVQSWTQGVLKYPFFKRPHCWINILDTLLLTRKEQWEQFELRKSQI